MTMTAPESTTTTTDPLAGIRIVDCDAHFTEPPDLWTSRAPASLAGRVPVQKTVDGRTGWFLHDEPWASTGGNTIQQGHQKILGSHVVQPFSDIDPAAWDVTARLELMDEQGIHAAVIYPNGVGFASNHVFAIEDLELREAILQIYNDFFVDIQHESGDRLLPQAMLPIWDMDLTIAEMTRLIDKGIRGFTLSDKPEMIGLPELWQDYYTPMWDLFEQSRSVANFHIGSGATREDMESIRGARFKTREQRLADEATERERNPGKVNTWWNEFDLQRRLAVHATQMYMSNVRIIINLCMSNLFDRHPGVKIVSAESGIGWVPFILEALEYQYDEMVTVPDELAHAERRPREYFNDHLYVMWWFETSGPAKLIEDIGANNVLVETDVPHPTCLYPTAREHFARVLADVDDHTRRRVLQDNAAELYRIDL